MIYVRALAPAILIVMAVLFGLAALVDHRWYSAAFFSIVVAYAIQVFTIYRAFGSAQAAEKASTAAAVWQERVYVIESAIEAAKDGKTLEEWYGEYLNYAAAHAVAEGHPVRRPD